MVRVISAMIITASLLVVPPVATQPAAAQDIPSIQETLDLLRDQWGRTTFQPTGVGDWKQTSHWTRVRQHLFEPGTDEFDGTPVEVTGLKPRTLELFRRSTPDGVERGIIEDVTEPDGSVTRNLFPPFRGDSDSFVFFNNVAQGVPLAGEYELTCREHSGGKLLLCRVIRPDHGIYYQVNAPTGESPRHLPSVRQVMDAFRDQWGRDRFTETGVGGWTRTAAWQRVRTLFFRPGTDEFTGEGEEGVGIPVRFEQYSRTLPGGRSELGVHHIAPDVPATTYFPPFRGDARSFTFSVVNTRRENPDAPLGEFEETCRILRRDATDFLICRTITPAGGINYQTAVLAGSS